LSLTVRNVVVRGLGAVLCIAGTTTALAAQAKPLPLKYVGPATVPAITAGDLMTRLYKYADDSMGGRPVGTAEHLKAVAYVEREVRRLGLKPGGTNGSYYQDFPIYHEVIDPASVMTVSGATVKFGEGFIAQNAASVANLPTLYVGDLADTTVAVDSAMAAGKLLIVRPLINMQPDRAAAVQKSAAYLAYRHALAGAAGTLLILPDNLYPMYRNFYGQEQESLTSAAAGASMGKVSLIISEATANLVLGAPAASATRGTAGQPVSANVTKTETVGVPGRNVIAILPGTDPKLAGEYVAIGAHSDHIAIQNPPREHDSLKVYNEFGRPAGQEGGRNLQKNPISADEWTKINADIAAMRKVYPARLDSISNGADDDGSGTVSVLEIAEAFAKGTVKPKRSIIFVWHAGEERGMWGSGYFTANPTIPRDSIVAQLNIDMVGRGEASDETGVAKDGTVLHGSPGYLQLVGSRRLSTELGDLVESVNTRNHHNITFDYSEDADGHPQDIYCRSDHWSYAKWNIPVVFFTTGGHADYHQVTDEPQYIQYGHMARVDSLIFDVAEAVANLDHAPVVDGKKMADPNGACRQ
jgi:hypothetical protein